MRKTAQLYMCLTAIAVICAASVRADQVDRYLAEQMRIKHVPGVSIAVVKNGRIIKQAGYGISNIEANSAATAKTVYEIGSVTKQFTAAAIMLLVQEGKISLDEPVAKYFRMQSRRGRE